jgi:hypothetical protein
MAKTKRQRQEQAEAEMAQRALEELDAGHGNLSAETKAATMAVERAQDAMMAETTGYGPIGADGPVGGQEAVSPGPPATRPAALEQDLEGPCFKLLGGDLPLAFQVGTAADGRLVCTGLLIGWNEPRAEVTARALRNIRLGEILGDLVPMGARAPTAKGRKAARALVTDAPRARTRRPGPAGHPREHYEQVAKLYKEAGKRRAPVKWVAEQMDASPATVHRWLQKCREDGLLARTQRRGPSTARTAKTTRRKP